MEQNKVVSQEDSKSFLEAQVNQAKYDLKHNLYPQLGHSQAKRLHEMMDDYPTVEHDVSNESEAFIKAYSAKKVLHDAQVALGTELVLQQMYQEQLEAMQSSQNKEK
jgi:hypothetical protein